MNANQKILTPTVNGGSAGSASPITAKPLKKSLFDEIQKLTGYCNEKTNDDIVINDLKILKDRYLITDENCYFDLSSSNQMNCIDIHTNERFLCKIINEPLDKVMLAYFHIQNSSIGKNDFDADLNEGHHLVKPAHDIISQSINSTYLIIRTNSKNNMENLHSYIRNCKRLQEPEAKLLFKQICNTVKLCHQNGVILRDIKLRKFFFINQDRTKLQYESLEGAVILNDSNDDTLTEKIGCPLYVSPELITPNSSYGGQSADMWALGVILYTILVGQYPFNDGNGQTLFTKISNCDFYLPSVLSCKARCLIRSLLRKNPKERLNSTDILYHPWFNDTENEILNNLEKRTDQCVPEFNSDVDMT